MSHVFHGLNFPYKACLNLSNASSNIPYQSVEIRKNEFENVRMIDVSMFKVNHR